MNDLADQVRAYLGQYFVSLPLLAETAGVAEAEIRALQAAACIPGPSYRVTVPDKIGSVIFGDTVIPGIGPPGEYYARSAADGVRVAAKRARSQSLGTLGAQMAAEFQNEFKAVLLARQSWRSGMDFLFVSPGVEQAEVMGKFLGETWQHFRAGTFGVCVREAGSVPMIAEKEIVQHGLTQLTDNGARLAYSPSEWERVTGLMRAHEVVAMPFAPHEYPRSSRKRLVDDLRSRTVVASL